MQNMVPTTATIESLTHDGRGVAHIDGKATFIEGALPGETVSFTYIRRRGNRDEGKILEVLEASEDRVRPECPHFGVCGGCSLQHMAHERQLALKQKTLLDQLKHFGGIEPDEILPPLTDNTYGYRHKARLGVKWVEKKGKVLIGFREKNGRFLADCEACPVLHPSVGTRLTALSNTIATLSIFKDIPQIEVAAGDNTTALVIRHLMPLDNTDIEKIIDLAKTQQFYIYLQPKGPDTVHRIFPAQGEPLLSYTLHAHGITLFFHPCDFTQVNSGINQHMVSKAIELLEPSLDDVILDLFCGLGNFTLPIARHCKQIVGIEGDEKMVERARYNAQHNRIENVAFYCTDLTGSPDPPPWAQQNYNKILLDPPRTGALECISSIKKYKAEKILYISCNPATLARDAGELIKQGYQLKKAGTMDMFPHTCHTEAIALFEA